MSVIVYHNPRCSKSRETVALLRAKQINFEPRLYMKDIPTKSELMQVLSLLGFTSARQLMRQKEKIYQTHQLAAVEDESVLIEAMLENPQLIERPIVIVNNQQAKIGRPPASVLSLFE